MNVTVVIPTCNERNNLRVLIPDVLGFQRTKNTLAGPADTEMPG